MLTALGDVSGNRFAYYVDTLLPEPADKTFSDFYRQYNLGISLDGAPDECVEWVHRFNRRIAINVNKKAELLNSILLLESGVLPTINTQTGEQQVVRGLHLLADINTLAENTEDRFTVDDVQDFSLNAQDIFLRLLQQVKEKLSV